MATCASFVQRCCRLHVQSITCSPADGSDRCSFSALYGGAGKKNTIPCIRGWRSRFSTPVQHCLENGHQRQAERRAGIRAGAETESTSETRTDSGGVEEQKQGADAPKGVALDKEVSKVVRKTAATFAPRASTKSKNPATKGSTLYTVFEVQAWISIVAGFLLSFNLIFPSDHPDIARLLGMWSVWMLAVPSLRARDCSAQEKEALNYLFVLIPFINVLIPVFWKSFAGVFTADCIAMVGMYAWKMEWLRESDASDK